MKRKTKTPYLSQQAQRKKNLSDISSIEQNSLPTSPSNAFPPSQSVQSISQNPLLNSDHKSSRSKSRKNSISASVSKLPSDPNTNQSPPHLLLTEEAQGTIDEKSINNILMLIAKDQHFEQYSVKPKEEANSVAKQSRYEQFEKFEYDCSLFKVVEIEIVSKKSEKFDDFKETMSNFFSDKDKFVYYEYSNTKNLTSFGMSQIDQISYESYFRNNFQLFFTQNKMRSKIEMLDKLRKINYITALNELYKNFILNKAFFYIITPMHSFYFNLSETNETIKESTYSSSFTVISNTLRLEKILDECEIGYKKIELNDNDAPHSIFNENPAVIDSIYMTHFYNTFINEYKNKNFNIFAPFPFEEATTRRCKISFKTIEKKDQNIIHIQLYGCVFQTELEKVITYLTNKKTHHKQSEYSFSLKLTRIPTTDSFYMLNKKLKRPVEKVEYKDNSFYIK